MHFIFKLLYSGMGFPGHSVVKSPPANAGDAGLICGSGISSGEGNGNPLQYSGPGKSHGQRSLMGYSPWVNDNNNLWIAD